jgi:HAD superfamily hydrolase (TIGR01509 family)
MTAAAGEAVLFDLFDTLVLFQRDRLPEIEINGRMVRSTAGHLHEAFRPFAPALSLGDFAGALFWSWQEAEKIRSGTHREVSAPERFGMLFGRLGFEQAAMEREALPLLLATHMRELSKAVVFPDHHRRVLEELGRRYRLAVVSNFDYTPTALMVLEREGVAHLFETILVSDAVGWRKPAPRIFEHALQAMGLAPAAAVFVGDRADIDVAGAHGVGMRAVWINRDGEALPEGVTAPAHEIRDLGELPALLCT